jgi:hypothetical protein
MKIEARASEQEQEAEEILIAVERRFKDVASGLSMASCAKRAHHDIALTMQSAVQSQMTTQFIGTIIEAVGNVIMTIFCVCCAIALIGQMGGPLGEAVGGVMMRAVEPFIIVEIGPIVEEQMGSHLLAQLEDNLLNKISSLVVAALVFHIPRAMGKEIPPRLLNYILRVEAPVLAKQISHNTLHALTQKVINNLAHVLVDTCALQVTEQLSHQLVNYFYCVYCYERGEFCRNCQTYNQFRALDSKVR